jgi:hypothetical protein
MAIIDSLDRSAAHDDRIVVGRDLVSNGFLGCTKNG